MSALGEQVAGAARFLALDSLRSITDVTDSSGNLVARFAFDPWGRRTQVAGSESTSIGYTGHRWAEHGAVWLALHRVYDPALGRWLSEDPAGVRHSPNLFAYVSNSPMNALDPLGLYQFQNCSEAQIKQIGDAVNTAKERLNKACCAGPKSQQIKDIVDKATYVCVAQVGGWIRPDSCGEAPRGWEGSIYLAERAWNTDVCGPSLVCTIVHEAMHHTQWAYESLPIVGGTEQESEQAGRNCCRADYPNMDPPWVPRPRP